MKNEFLPLGNGEDFISYLLSAKKRAKNSCVIGVAFALNGLHSIESDFRCISPSMKRSRHIIQSARPLKHTHTSAQQQEVIA